MTRKILFAAVGMAALIATVPTAASAQSGFAITIGSGSYGNGYNGYGYNGYGNDRYRDQDHHQRQHDRLEDEHEDNHQDLDEAHEQAHEQGLSWGEHRQLHRELNYEHEALDYQTAVRHQREHQRGSWDRRYNQRRYNPYYGY